MSKLNKRTSSRVAAARWAWLLPLLTQAALAFAGSACSNAGVIGDDCPTSAECATAGSAGTGTSVGMGKTCGGLLGTLCGNGRYCDFPSSSACGAGDQTGVCKASPDECLNIFAPVCGCDGKTYTSACSANSAGVSVATSGKCDSDGSGGSGNTGSGGSGNTGSGGTPSGGTGSGTTCGGIAPASCPDPQYCSFPVGAECGAGDQTGTCAKKPEACDLSYAPVCGCDGITYGNPCAAASAGISVAKNGECADAGGTCGGRGQGTRASNEYCKYAPAAMCGRADASGTCTELVKDSACITLHDPVCGCDRKTYGNECEAMRMGASVDYKGECASAGPCGGLLGEECADGYFCYYPIATACGNGDVQGSCTEIPSACTKELNPVCGCDGEPYNNPCEANAQGTSVANLGACP